MDQIRQFMILRPTPMAARLALAMSRALAPFDATNSEDLRDHAHGLAADVGRRTQLDDMEPILFRDEDGLLVAFHHGRQEAIQHAAYLEENPPTVWSDGWKTSWNGEHETRASVAQSADGYLPGLEISRLGGDCDPGYGAAVSTLKAAIGRAIAREYDWHNSEPEEA